ncbi:DNA methyltransferase [Limnohabitans sp. Rim8]|uniref:Eco57I restriction-modification methylase domain-containing protein n=1 Tax=Limnohabitans sp. Rim8 TaxID=1100718 RepID=UPI0025EDBAC1|nr:DNA methyltransferase [Limnohabitans sp. Rim8]
MSAPTASRHHSDWLSLVEISGPFVSLPVLLRVFSQGLEPRDPTQAKALRAAYEDWQDNPAAPGQQRAWVLHVLTTVLGYPANQVVEGQALPAGLEAKMPEMGETLRPDFALTGPAGTDTSGKAQLLISSYPAEQKLDRPVIGKHWKATPATRMMELLHGAGVPLGLVTNGEQWMLVYAPRGEITGYASWFGALWLDEPITLRAFHSLLGVRRFFGVADDSTLLALLKESANDQQEVTDQLGFQVREAVEVLVQSFDAIDKDSGRVLLKGVRPNEQYEAALTIMMRLVFLFSAEERGLLHLGKPLYDNNYAVSTLQEQLQEVADLYGEEVLERRTDAWARLLSSFRAVHGGVKHQDLLMQAYGGSLFDPDRYPFLEGRTAGSLWRETAAEPLSVNNRVVLHLLNSLQRLRIKPSAGGVAETRRVSFRALGVEQIGHVYEGLLDHTCVLAAEPVLGIKGPRNKEAEIPLSKLESLLAQGQDKLVEFLKDITGRSLSAIRKTLDDGSLLDEHKILVACGYDHALLNRLSPFARLIREDSFERPLVVLTGSVYVTAGTDRRSSGTHYTPPTLTEPIVQHTLEPLVYQGPADGWPRERWTLKSPKDILDLKVCDMAMGSGAFLVQVCRYMAERLVEAWEGEEKLHPGQVLITPDGKFSEGSPSERLVPTEAAERIAVARRVVADRCLYGVDINPMAVEMAKLSLWLITVDAHRPFTFLDHAFKCGDSLLGITSFEQLENFSLRPGGVKQQTFSSLHLRRHIDEAKKKREALGCMPSDTPEQIAAKAVLFAEAEDAVTKLNAAADILMAVELQGLQGKAYEALREKTSELMIEHWVKGTHELKDYARLEIGQKRCFHWALMFPEISSVGGFNAFIGNPPFLGGSRAVEVFGDEYASYLVTLHSLLTKKTDFCCHFFRRADVLTGINGSIGLIGTNTITQGASRRGTIEVISSKRSISYAKTGLKWPGQAQLEVVVVVFSDPGWKGTRYLNDALVENIDSLLTGSRNSLPKILHENDRICFIGVHLGGTDGFIVSEIQAQEWIKNNIKNKNILFPFIRGEDIGANNLQAAPSWIISFGEMNHSEAEQYTEPFNYLKNVVFPERQKKNKEKYPRMVNEWWKFWHSRNELYKDKTTESNWLVKTRVSSYHGIRFVPSNWIHTDGVVIFKKSLWSDFSILQSSIHEAWTARFSSTLGSAPRYIPTDCFETFPLPVGSLMSMNDIGKVFHAGRQEFLDEFQSGLTNFYRKFHNSNDFDKRLVELRNLQSQMDFSVMDAYGWGDIILGHNFYDTKHGVRYTISEDARREILDRLLDLNHQRYAAEKNEQVVQSEYISAKRGRKLKDASGQITMDL